MKKRISLLLVFAMLLSCIPVAFAAENAETLISVTDETVTTEGYTYTFTADSAGTMNVTVGTCTPGWRYKIYTPDGAESTYRSKWTAGESCDYTGEAGNWKIVFYAYSSAEADNVDGTVSFTVTFTPNSSTEEPEVPKEEYQVADAYLELGDNNVTLLDTAITTIYVFEPTETGVFTFTAPAGAILGYWGAGSWFLMDPNSTTNTYEWTCTGVGQTAYIGVSGVEGAFNLNVEKTGDYTVVEIPIIAYENKAELEPFTVPAGATLGGYVDVMGDAVHTAVLGSDGYYHLDSVDGPILLIDLDYMDIILSAALQSDRPVMYAYVTDENGNTVKYDIGEAIKAYEAVMDENGYYPVTEDILLFYQVYAMGAGTFTYHLTGMDYNEDCVWMYCMRTMTLPQPAVPVAKVGDTEYTSIADAIAACGQGQYIVLIADVTEDVVIDCDVYLDLNGHTLTGNVSGNGMLYGMDSATDDYDDADAGQIVGMVSCNVPGSFQTDIKGETQSYMTISGKNGISFHRYYVGITKVSLNPAVTGFGYKAEFYGDNAVKALVASVGYDLWLHEDGVVSRTLDTFQNVVTLRLKNFMVDQYGETPVNAKAYITLNDGTKLESAVHSYSMRSMVENVNAGYTQFTAAQLKAAAQMILASDVMQTWEVENILKAMIPQTTVEHITVEGEDMLLATGGQITLTLAGACSFTAQDTAETIDANPYANWKADFVVSMDRVAQEGLYLAGNYGIYGWIALPVAAGVTYTEVPVLKTTLDAEMTYREIVEQVGSFSCGVADIAAKNMGATITVELRLTNPEDPSQFQTISKTELVIPVIEITYAEYLDLSAEDKMAYQEAFGDEDAFWAWYDKAYEEYENGKTEAGDGEVVIP